jgi:urease accessory protein
LIAAHPLLATAGATSPNPQVLVVRCLSPVVEPAMGLLRQIWGAWRAQLWQCGQETPRLWAT